jgi:hypothetical protein
MSAETPVERRLRSLVHTRELVERGCTTYDRDRWMPEHVALTHAIDLGREAVTLIIDYMRDVGDAPDDVEIPGGVIDSYWRQMRKLARKARLAQEGT